MTGAHDAASPRISVRRAELGTTMARIVRPNVKRSNARPLESPGSSPGMDANIVDEFNVAVRIVVARSITRSVGRRTRPFRQSAHWPRYIVHAAGTITLYGSRGAKWPARLARFARLPTK